MKSVAFATAAIPFGLSAIGLGLVFAALLRAESYAPEIGNTLFGRAMLGFALIESFTILVFVLVGLIVIF